MECAAITIEVKRGGIRNGWMRAVVRDDDGITYVGPYRPNESTALQDGQARLSTALSPQIQRVSS
ncbi:hypothetical protein [Tropicimonas sp. IMCC34011]|uniref:hypothetical protein n=1 Tax=Tropicimonas sp. IMCC34011 TaxID=2248759 RepID=UPI000E25AF2B|nr:hypothetical protein [Tropicimonas sp. IMCC34011]